MVCSWRANLRTWYLRTERDEGSGKMLTLIKYVLVRRAAFENWPSTEDPEKQAPILRPMRDKGHKAPVEGEARDLKRWVQNLRQPTAEGSGPPTKARQRNRLHQGQGLGTSTHEVFTGWNYSSNPTGHRQQWRNTSEYFTTITEYFYNGSRSESTPYIKGL